MSINKSKSVQYAIATMRLEGFTFTQEELADLDKLGRGEVTTEELRRKCLIRIEQLKKKRPELFGSDESGDY